MNGFWSPRAAVSPGHEGRPQVRASAEQCCLTSCGSLLQPQELVGMLLASMLVFLAHWLSWSVITRKDSGMKTYSTGFRLSLPVLYSKSALCLAWGSHGSYSWILSPLVSLHRPPLHSQLASGRSTTALGIQGWSGDRMERWSPTSRSDHQRQEVTWLHLQCTALSTHPLACEFIHNGTKLRWDNFTPQLPLVASCSMLALLTLEVLLKILSFVMKFFQTSLEHVSKHELRFRI